MSTAVESKTFDVREATIASVHNALFTRQHSCRDIVSAFIARIERHNPALNAVITLNPHALEEADQFDLSLKAGNATGPLFGIPILLKDSFDAVGMPTTGACVALSSLMPTKDAPSVAALRNAGAIILGKSSLHELAMEGLSVSSLCGQVVNPYDFSRTPGGSSGGTGAAVAASFAVLGTGTDTVNSLRSPASANNLYSFRPTYGLISRAGIIPVSSTQDAAGAIGRSLYDIATVLTVMSDIGYDPLDDATARVPTHAKKIDYTTALVEPSSIKGARIGVLQGFFNYTSSPETDPVNSLMASTIASVTSAGAEIIYLNDTTTYDAPNILATLDVQQFEFRELFNAYLSSPDLTGSHPTSMEELYLTNQNTPNFLVIPNQYTHIQHALTRSTKDAEYTNRLQGIANLTKSLHDTFSTNKLDAIIYPQQKNLVVPIGSPSQAGRNGILAGVTGLPVIAIPIGFSDATETAPIGVPVGMEIMGMPWSEAKLLGIAKAIDDRLHARRAPVTNGLDEVVEVTGRYESVPVVRPAGAGNLDRTAYPLGTLGR